MFKAYNQISYTSKNESPAIEVLSSKWFFIAENGNYLKIFKSNEGLVRRKTKLILPLLS